MKMRFAVRVGMTFTNPKEWYFWVKSRNLYIKCKNKNHNFYNKEIIIFKNQIAQFHISYKFTTKDFVKKPQF